MNTICITSRGHVECPAYFNVFPLVAAIVEPTRIVLAHPLNYSAHRALLRFFARSPRIFNLLSIAHYPSFADVTHHFNIGRPPLAPPRKPPRRDPSKIDWSPLESYLGQSSGQSSQPRGLLMKPSFNTQHLVENMLSADRPPHLIRDSRVVPHNAMFYAPVDSSLESRIKHVD